MAIATAIKNNDINNVWKLFFDANKFDVVSKTNFFVDSVIIDYFQKKDINVFELQKNSG